MNVVLEETIYSRAPELFDSATEKYRLIWNLIKPLEEKKALNFYNAGAKAFIIGTKKYSPEFYSSLRAGTLMQRFGVGYTSVPVDLCKERGILVGYTPGVLETAVAEHAMMLICALARTVCTFEREMKSGQWRKIEGTELRGKTLALIGFGRIARETAKIATFGFGMKISAYDIIAPDDDIADEFFTGIEQCVAGADYISLHLPDTPQTAGIINAALLKKMKRTAFVINTARGSLINEPDLYTALKEKQIAGAALDVFAKEPYEPALEADFRTLDNCILTPHCASNTSEANARMAEICIANCVALAAGRTDDLFLL
ncbi:MAG: NAD(P)-dependent oxidoreductase [Kiritimatiellales bacterium]